MDLLEVMVFVTVAAILTVIALSTMGVLKSPVNVRDRLIKQCVDDGNKEYECRAMNFN
jgi:Tfp pilus assembly protein FimT